MPKKIGRINEIVGGLSLPPLVLLVVSYAIYLINLLQDELAEWIVVLGLIYVLYWTSDKTLRRKQEMAEWQLVVIGVFLGVMYIGFVLLFFVGFYLVSLGSSEAFVAE